MHGYMTSSLCQLKSESEHHRRLLACAATAKVTTRVKRKQIQYLPHIPLDWQPGVLSARSILQAHALVVKMVRKYSAVPQFKLRLEL